MYTGFGTYNSRRSPRVFEKKWDLRLCGSPKVFGMKKGYGTYTHKEAQKFWKRDRDESSSIA